MSKLQVGKLSLQCSMDVIKKAIKNIITEKCSECAKHIKVSDKTDLEIRSVNMDDNPGKFDIVILKEAGISHADIGIKREANNSWTLKGDDYKIRAFQAKIVQEVFAMRTRAIAELKNLEIVKDEMDGLVKVITIRKKIEN